RARFVMGITLDRLDQRRHQVPSPLELNVDVAPGPIRSFAQAHQLVVGPDDQAQDHENHGSDNPPDHGRPPLNGLISRPGRRLRSLARPETLSHGVAAGAGSPARSRAEGIVASRLCRDPGSILLLVASSCKVFRFEWWSGAARRSGRSKSTPILSAA